MGKLTVHALRAVLAVVLTGTVLIQVLMVWTLIGGNDPEALSSGLSGSRVSPLWHKRHASRMPLIEPLSR